MVNEKKVKRRNGLRKLYDLHAWVGFHLAIVMFVILFTGTIATISNEIDWLLFDEMRASQKSEQHDDKTEAQDWVQIYKNLNSTYPGVMPRALFTMHEDYLTHRAVLPNDVLKNRYVTIDQWTHEVTGDIPRLTVQRFFRDFHRYLFMPQFPGILFVCAFAFVLAISLYTGIKTTKNWRTALWRMRVNQGTRIALSDGHKLLGLWGIWFVSIMIFTSLWYLYEFGSNVAGARVEPRSIRPVVAEQQVTSVQWTVEDFEKAISVAQQAHDDWHITVILLPTKNNRYAQFRGVGNNPLLRDRAYRAFVDPVSLQLVETWTPESIGSVAYLNEYMDPLHFGYFGSVWSKVVWFLFGLSLTAMSVTGVLMTYKRTKSTRISKAQIATLPLLVFASVAFYFWLPRFLS